VSTRLSEQISGTLPLTMRLREAFDDGRLADAGLADEHRVVLGAAAEDLDDALDLVLAADDGSSLPFAGELGEVAAEGCRARGSALWIRPRSIFMSCSTLAAMPSPSFRRPSRMCSVPM
jgi:hypothetical protein